MSEKWVDVSAVDNVPKGDVTAVKVDGKELALYEVEGNIYATDNL
jgi:naphthalene 1,2-dioxygenase system ferredoxin subunit